MNKKHVHFLIAFVAGGIFFAPVWRFVRGIGNKI